MTAIRNKSRKGFTLVEILIVVIILGILAAIVIPQFTNASEDARKSNMQQPAADAAQPDRAVQAPAPRHAARHQRQRLVADVVCTNDADVEKTTAADDVPDATVKFGPYMQAAPVNPLTEPDSVGRRRGTGRHGDDRLGLQHARPARSTASTSSALRATPATNAGLLDQATRCERPAGGRTSHRRACEKTEWGPNDRHVCRMRRHATRLRHR